MNSAKKRSFTERTTSPVRVPARAVDHVLWKERIEGGHGGTDSIELREFVRSVRTGTQTPIDVYDSVTMTAILPLSQQSIAQGSAPVKCLGFTGGKWQTTKPKFALDMKAT